MNPFAHIQVCKVDNLEETLGATRYSAVIYGFRSFKEALNISNACRKQNIPFYLLNTSGLFGFFFIDVGSDLTFTYHKKATESEETQTIRDSRTLEQYF